MLKTLFQEQRESLNHFFDTLLLHDAEVVLEKALHCKGDLILTGVGKSGYIAQKISATLSSTGSRSFFLDPSSALHGDLGRLQREDLFICLSKSGSTQELIRLLPFIQKRGIFTISIVSQKLSRLAEISDFSLHLPLDKELCPYDLAPTTSSTIQLIFGDCLAMALMKKRQFSLDQFAENHPGGSLGRKISFKVADLMLKGPQLPLCSPESTLIDVLHEFSSKKCGCLIVTDANHHLHGIFTDGDLRRALQQKGTQALLLPLKDLMTSSPKSIEKGVLAMEAIQKMEEDPSQLITVLPVVEKEKIVGLIRMHDILQKEFS